MRALTASSASSRLVSPYSSFVELYDFLIGDPAFPAIRRAFDRSVKQFGLGFRSIADIGCGTGRFLAELEDLGVDRIGVDCSASALAVARGRLAGQPVLLLRQDIRRLSLPHPVDLITCHNQTVNYLTSAADLTRALHSIARNLRGGGAFVFDCIRRMRQAGGRRRITEDIRLPEHHVKFDGMIDESQGLSTLRISLVPQGARRRPTFELHRQCWFFPAALYRLLNASGFRVLEMRPIDDQHDGAWIHVVARRL